MPKALGLVETRGLVAAIEAADAMVKAANVKIVGKEQTNPALITIKIVGDVAAVKSAVDAGAAAAQKVGELVSIHVIPQPDSQMISLFPELADDDSPAVNVATIPSVTEVKKTVKEARPVKSVNPENQEEHFDTPAAVPTPSKIEKTNEAISKVQTKVVGLTADVNNETKSLGNLFTSQNDTISRLRQEALGNTQKKKLAPLESEKSELVAERKEKIYAPVSDDIEHLNVHQLRSLARETENFPIKGREISKANRQELLEFFRKKF
jgi:ethanolamine utilization protein EutM